MAHIVKIHVPAKSDALQVLWAAGAQTVNRPALTQRALSRQRAARVLEFKILDAPIRR
jgi:hypothetical protein